jgi:hypothetical protein
MGGQIAIPWPERTAIDDSWNVHNRTAARERFRQTNCSAFDGGEVAAGRVLG